MIATRLGVVAGESTKGADPPTGGAALREGTPRALPRGRASGSSPWVPRSAPTAPATYSLSSLLPILCRRWRGLGGGAMGRHASAGTQAETPVRPVASSDCWWSRVIMPQCRHGFPAGRAFRLGTVAGRRAAPPASRSRCGAGRRYRGRDSCGPSREHGRRSRLGGLARAFRRSALATLEAVAGWQTERVRRPVLILGQLDGILTGIRQLRRTRPLETGAGRWPAGAHARGDGTHQGLAAGDATYACATISTPSCSSSGSGETGGRRAAILR